MSTNISLLGGEDIEAGRFTGHVSDTERRISQIEVPVENMVDGGNIYGNVVETDRWASSLESMLEEVPRYMCSPGHPGRISRIPESLREVDRKSYEPCFLSIGPYHHGKLSLQCTEKTKWVILKYFLEQKPTLTLKDMLKEIKNIEPEARSFYTDVEMDSESFVQMLLLDSLYLVILFCGMPESRETTDMSTEFWTSIASVDSNERVDSESMVSESDSNNTEIMVRSDQSNAETWSGENNLHGPRWFWPLLVHDLFLLENQIPFFVLQKVHHLAYGSSETQLIVTLKTMFHNLLLDHVKLDSELVISPTEEVHHLLHLCHMFFRPTNQHDLSACQLPESSQMFRLGSAVQLYQAGVSFEVKSYSSEHSLLDITFSSSGMLAMPCLNVDDNTNSLLRNLIALEQMKYPSLGLDVSAYAVFLLHIVTIPEDVNLLRRKGIIQHHLASDKEMVYLINRLSVGLAFDYTEDKYTLKPVFHELKRYSDNRVSQWRAWLKHRYFNNPWTTISLMATSFLLFLSALQTFYTVYSYYHPFFDGHS